MLIGGPGGGGPPGRRRLADGLDEALHGGAAPALAQVGLGLPVGLPLRPLLVGQPYGAGLEEFIPRAAVVWGPAVPALRHESLRGAPAFEGLEHVR